MKKLLLIFASVMFFSWQASATTIQVGTGTTTQGNYPINSCYNYSFSQQIVLASEYSAGGGVAGDITKIRFYYDGGSTNPTLWDDWDVFLGHTAKSFFANGGDWEPLGNLTQVFSGTITPVAGNWYEITFLVPFTYNGTDNILVAIDQNKNGWECTAQWRSYTAGGNQGIFYREDGADVDPNTPPTATGFGSDVAQIQFEGVGASCLPPTALAATNITTGSADLGWTTGGASQWIVEWGATGFAQGSGTIVDENTVTNSYTLSGLAANTAYDFYVRDFCSAGDSSAWAGPYTFTTLCSPYTVPYFEGFEAGYVDQSEVAGCLSQETLTGTQTWTANSTSTTYNRTPRTGSFNAYLRYSNEDWLFIPIDLVGGTSYDAEVYARQDGTTTTNADVTISYGVSATDADMTNAIVAATGIDATYQLISGSFIPAASGTYYIGIKGYMNGSPWYISIDDITIRETPACPAPTALTATNITAATADLGWTTGGSAQWIIEWGATGFAQGAGTIIDESTATNPYTLSGLTPETAYDFYVRDFCAAGDSSAWVGPFSFTTLASCLEPTALTATNIVATSADLGWTTGGATQWNIEWGATGFAQGAGTMIDETMATNPYSLTGLTANTSYDFYVRDVCSVSTSDLVISGVFDGQPSWAGGSLFPKGFELYVVNDIADLSIYGVGSANNGGGTDGEELTLSGSATAGDYIYIASDSTGFRDFFGFDADYVDGAANINGDDAIELFMNGGVIDVFGDINTDGTGTAWEYLDGWAYRMSNTGPDGTTFTIGNWTISAIDDLQGAADNASSTNPFPIGTFLTAGSDLSTWVGPFTFTTPCDVYTPDYTADFTTFLPACWGEGDGGDGTTGPIVGNGDWRDGGNTLASNSARINLYTTGSDDWLISPMFDLSTGGYELVMDVAVTNWNSAAADAMGSDDFVEVFYSEDGVTWTSITSWTAADALPNTLTQFIYPLASTGANVQFAILASEGATNDAEDYDFHVGGFVVRTPPSCLEPTALGTFNLTSTSADLYWTDNASAADWEYEWGTAGFAQGTGTVVPVTNDTASLAGLTADTDYEFYVRAVCGVGNESIWAGPFSFFTGYCTPAPISVDGNGITNVTMGTINNTTGTEPGNYGDYSAMITDAQQTSTLNIDITLETGFTYNLWAWVDWNDDLDFTGADEVFYLGESLGNNPTTFSSSITVPATASLGNHRIRIGGADSGLGTTPPSDPCYTGSWGAFEDYTLNVTPPPACVQPTALGTDNLLGTTTDILWTDNAGASEWEYEYGLAGFAQGTGTVDQAFNDTVSLSGLTALTNYEFYVRAVCGAADSSAWAGPFAFSTNTDCRPLDGNLATINDCVLGTYDIEVDITTMGDASTWYVTDGTDTLGTITSLGTSTFGPFTSGIATGLYFLHDSDTLCDIGPVNMINAACNDSLCDAIELTVNAAPIDGNSVGSTAETGEPAGACWFTVVADNTVWYSFVAPPNGEVTVTTDFVGGSMGDTHLALYESTTGDCTDMSALSVLGCDDDGGVDVGLASVLNVTGLTSGETYFVQVDGWNGATGTFQIQITSPCSEPTDLAVANETDNSADLSWTSNGLETEWEIEYGLAGFTPGTGMTVVVSTNPYTLTGLDEDTEYEFYVSAICGAGDTSAYSAVDTINTLYLCDDPTTVSATNVTATSVDVSWTDNAGVSSFSIEYGPTGFTLGTGTTETATSSPYTITGLNAETDYDVYVSADCGANGTSNGVSASFTTLESCPAPSGVMTSNVTASSVDVAWTENGSASAWEIEYVLAGNAQGTGTVVSAATNPFTVTGLMENTSYDVFVRSVCGAGDESDWVGGASTNFMTGESCPAPTDLLVSNVTASSADFSWTENGNATQWTIEYGAPGFTVGTGTVAVASSNPFAINGLSEDTDYEFYVYANCGVGDVSDTVGPSATFTTLGTDIVNLGNGQSVDVYSYDNTIALAFSNVSASSAQVEVYDMIGKVVATEIVETVGTQTIQLDNVTTGVYLVRLAIDKETNTIKVFIQNN